MKQILIIALAAALANSACLSADVLTSLGFSSTQAVAVIAAPTVCTNLFSTVGTCVPQDAVQAKLTADNSAFSAKADVYADVVTSLGDLATIVASTSADSKTQVQTIQANAKANSSACLEAWSTLQQGITCYLASGDASSNTTVNGSTVTVNLNSAIVGSYLQNCTAYIDSICLLTAGVSISSSVTVSDSAFLTNQATLGAPCQTLKANYGCTTATCNQANYDVLINTFFQPYTYTIFPSISIFTDISTKFKSLSASISTWFSSVTSSGTSTSTSTNGSATTTATTGSANTSTSATTTGTNTSANSSTAVTSSLIGRKLASTATVQTKSTATGGSDAKTNGQNSGASKITSSAGIYAMSVLIMAAFAVISK